MFWAIISDKKADGTRDCRVLEAVLTLSVLESPKRNSRRQNDRFVVGPITVESDSVEFRPSRSTIDRGLVKSGKFEMC